MKRPMMTISGDLQILLNPMRDPATNTSIVVFITVPFLIGHTHRETQRVDGHYIVLVISAIGFKHRHITLSITAMNAVACRSLCTPGQNFLKLSKCKITFSSKGKKEPFPSYFKKSYFYFHLLLF